MSKTSNLNRPILTSFAENWKYFLTWGIILVLLGILALYFTTATTLISVMILGFLFLTSGVVFIIDAFQYWWQKWTGFALHLLMGLLYAAAGLVLFFGPGLGAISLTLFIGSILIAAGVIRIIYSLWIRFTNWGWSLASGILSLLLGILILSEWPQSGLFIIGLFIGIDLLFIGMTYILLSFSAKKLWGK